MPNKQIECCCHGCVVLMNFDLSQTDHLFYSLPLVRGYLPAYHSAHDCGNKAANLALDSGANVQDCDENHGKDDIVGSSHSLS